jgi:hypothetical protein
VILSSWFLALVMFGLVFLAGTAIGAAFSSSKAPATTLANAEKPHLPHPEHARGKPHGSKPQHLTKQQKLEDWYAHVDAELESKTASDAKTSKLAGHTTSGRSLHPPSPRRRLASRRLSA